MVETSPSNLPNDDAARTRILYIGARAEGVRITRTLREDTLEIHSLERLELLESCSIDELQRTGVVFLDLERCGAGAEDAVRALRRACPHASIVVLAGDLDGEQAARLLSSGVPSLKKPVRATALAELALRLSLRDVAKTTVPAGGSRAGRLEPILCRYAEDRGLSGQQRTILRLHLAGKNDKEIASDCSCSEATVYEHWRRMARKAGGNHKSCVIIDFHRFLDDG